MNTLVSFVRYVAMFVVAGLLTPALSAPLAQLDKSLFYSGAGFDINLAEAGTMFFALETIFAFLLILFGEKVRYRNHILTIVVFLLIAGISLDPVHFYFPAGLILLGAGLGWVVRWLAANTLGKMPALEPYKKYF